MSFSVSTLLFQILSLKQIKQKKTFFIVKYETYRKMHRVQLNQLLLREDPCNLTQGRETEHCQHTETPYVLLWITRSSLPLRQPLP